MVYWKTLYRGGVFLISIHLEMIEINPLDSKCFVIPDFQIYMCVYVENWFLEEYAGKHWFFRKSGNVLFWQLYKQQGIKSEHFKTGRKKSL